MMRVIARIYKWIVISVILQILLLMFLNNYYLVKGVDVKTTSFDMKEEPVEDKGLEIPADADKIKVSFDGSYVAYMMDGKVEIKDIKSEKEKDVLTPGPGGIIDFYKWLPDRNMVIYSVKSSEGEDNRIEIFTKDIDSGLDNSYPKITKLGKESEVLNIELSPLTNVAYAKIKSSSSSTKVYKFDIMDHYYYIMNIDKDAFIYETNYKDGFLYEDMQKNRVRVWDGSEHYSWSLPFKEKIVLLGIDSEDKIYVGEVGDNDKVTRIYFGKMDKESHKSWTKIDLNEPVDRNNIIVEPNGKIFRLDDNQKVIIDIGNGKQIKYSGNFIELLDNYIVYLNKGKLKIDVIN